MHFEFGLHKDFVLTDKKSYCTEFRRTEGFTGVLERRTSCKFWQYIVIPAKAGRNISRFFEANLRWQSIL